MVNVLALILCFDLSLLQAWCSVCQGHRNCSVVQQTFIERPHCDRYSAKPYGSQAEWYTAIYSKVARGLLWDMVV